MVIALLIAVAVAGVVAVAEWLHARRTGRARYLAFGAKGRPALWAAAAPFVRGAGAAAATWGALALIAYDPVARDTVPAPRASRQLLVCLDVSPSMQIKDAGPDAEKLSRARWAGEVVQALLDRVGTSETRMSVVAFYTKALPILIDTYDKEVVRNLMDGLPMYVAFEPGSTDLSAGVNAALDLARPWARRCATLVVVSDGDASRSVQPATIPPSIADAIVIGVGDPNRASLVSGHASRQDVASLKLLAARLGGVYHNGNRVQLPTAVLNRLTMATPQTPLDMGSREAGLVALCVGCGLLGLIGPALMRFGLRRASRQCNDHGLRATGNGSPLKRAERPMSVIRFSESLTQLEGRI